MPNSVYRLVEKFSQHIEYQAKEVTSNLYFSWLRHGLNEAGT
jgi:hypothetical protein